MNRFVQIFVKILANIFDDLWWCDNLWCGQTNVINDDLWWCDNLWYDKINVIIAIQGLWISWNNNPALRSYILASICTLHDHLLSNLSNYSTGDSNLETSPSVRPINSKSDQVCGLCFFSFNKSAKKVAKLQQKISRQKCENHKNHKNLVSMGHFCWEYPMF